MAGIKKAGRTACPEAPSLWNSCSSAHLLYTRTDTFKFFSLQLAVYLRPRYWLKDPYQANKVNINVGLWTLLRMHLKLKCYGSTENETSTPNKAAAVDFKSIQFSK